ncbi:PPK2 family polyphosphate--nucleotide phosphotransferase [Corynebacterium accolens]|uniref:PPK2 family polyphosphate--nucleotide phosphotransferase n=1 Tax=Corynebacterium accolens TaxID=38284 RepID=A0AAP4BYB9_9CORY|nr:MULTISPECIES: PPK2 family polyphosphate--nucleotide phosphotransferase [Corynebacterium]ERS58775.1 PPK2 family polyphosphate:nucleotide phosphotransferase [Corynebacterium sp. KPL1818]MDK4247452.1 PPK2 family polyphosphate--nucleotide phosphotransferase [Corynebacterium accolens]MDK4323285.1 PPK2 family polyphosphate--nucleotide phosphotransferase [Corynebacterium accolens]MDK4334322.1 PPK2 family polyphosphate--nucleotide phosphotransferase [Corynebacterium accolens]
MGKFKIKDALDLRAGKTFRLADVDPTATPGFDGSKSDLADRFERYDDELYDLQERLFANGRAHSDDAPSLLVVLQGMDTSGKGGAIRHVFSVFDPQGTKTVGFGKPTEEEMEHDFLWRIRKHDPVPGQVVAFDRSHYEDVLIQRVHEWVDEEEIDRRFEAIREYEQELAGKRVKILKVFLHISPEFQKDNLIERTEREDKYWKYDPSDLEERGYWDKYMAAYEDAIRRTDELWAPWFVIPTDNKKYARMALKYLIVDALRHLNLSWPAPEFDPEAEKQRILDAD